MVERLKKDILLELKEKTYLHRFNKSCTDCDSSVGFHKVLKESMCKYGLLELTFLDFYIYGDIKHDKKELILVLNSMKYDVRFIKAISDLTYREFLTTNYWKLVRSLCLKKAENKCELCFSGKKLNVHHKTYKHHYQEHKYYKTDLIVLCESCHSIFHNKIKD